MRYTMQLNQKQAGSGMYVLLPHGGMELSSTIVSVIRPRCSWPMTFKVILLQ